MTTDWLLRVGDGENLKRSSKYRIWGIQSTSPDGKYFVKNVKPGDRLWFVTSKSHGKVIAVATYRSHNTREFGPLIDISLTEEELGWTGSGPDWTSNVEVHYTDLYNLNACDLLTHIKSAKTVRTYNEKCRVNLAVEYSYIVRYGRVTFEL
jgi:predicted secreted protein